MSSVRNQMSEQLRQSLAPLIKRYQGLEKREQLMVSVLGFVFIVFCLYWLVWAPIVAKRNHAQQNYQAHQQVYEWIHEHEDLIRRNKGSTQSQSIRDTNKDVLTLVNEQAGRSNVALRSFSPESDNKLRLQLEQQEFTQVMQWLYTLEQSYGIEVGNIDISAGSAPGTVNVRATLQRDN